MYTLSTSTPGLPRPGSGAGLETWIRHWRDTGGVGTWTLAELPRASETVPSCWRNRRSNRRSPPRRSRTRTARVAH